jgi:uncharacterized protein (DUF1697 family)
VALVVLLRGVNVGGHRTFRPTTLAEQLRHLDAVNIGAAGTLVIRRPITQTNICLGKLDELFGVPVTTRNGNTIAAVGRVLADGET